MSTSLVTAGTIVIFNLLAGYDFAHPRFWGATPILGFGREASGCVSELTMQCRFKL